MSSARYTQFAQDTMAREEVLIEKTGAGEGAVGKGRHVHKFSRFLNTSAPTCIEIQFFYACWR
jgi:hypothetical protein